MIAQLIGNTPLIRCQQLNTNPNVELWFKLEGQNPGGSIKDRAALNMVRTALESGAISLQTPLIEATSGNTGIALAMICAIYGLSIELVMPENSTIERVKTMKAYGAKVTLTPASDGIEASRDYAQKRVTTEGYFSFNQFDNPANSQAHYLGTGPEIWRDTHQQVTHFVATMGTTGTISGTGRFLKEQNPSVKVIGVQPKEGAKIPGIRKWSAEYMPNIFEPSAVDEVSEVSLEEATTTMELLAKKEGVFAGISSGGSVKVALDLCNQLDKGLIVAIICDRGDRYLSDMEF
jgi:S-sulfo-L-cysteine synthase (O-acetyl-L-serine-dependent)